MNAAIPLLGAALGCAASDVTLGAAGSPELQARADQFLELVNAGCQALYRVESEAQWNAATDVSPEHDAASETAGEALCDAATKTHVNDTPAYSYAIATVLKFQLHEHIARNILRQPAQSCNYAGNKEVGTFLRGILAKGGTEDWRKVLRDATGEDLSTRAMVAYFKPLLAWLEQQNAGRKIGWD